jgi:hypothetical protein
MATKTFSIRPEMSAAVRGLIDANTVRGASRQLQIAEATVARIAAGIPCTRGTSALVSARLIDLGLLNREAA